MEEFHYNFPTFSVNFLCLTLLCSMAVTRVLPFIIDDGNFCGDPMNDEDQYGIMNTSFKFFWLQCVARHTSVHQKKLRIGLIGPPPCPYCRQPVSSQTLNHSLQKMIANVLSLQQKLEQVEADKIGFCDSYQQAQTRFQILQNELQKSIRKKEVKILSPHLSLR